MTQKGFLDTTTQERKIMALLGRLDAEVLLLKTCLDAADHPVILGAMIKRLDIIKKGVTNIMDKEFQAYLSGL